MDIWRIICNYREALLGGLLVTLELCVIIWSVGLFVGAVLGVAGAKWRKSIGFVSRCVFFVLSGIPILVLLFWLHYPVQAMLNIVVDPFWTASCALSILNIFLVAQVIRGVLNDFPSQYTMAAKACGLKNRETLIRIKLPIILRQMLPSLLMIQVNMLQMTLFASLISVPELFRVAQRIDSMEYKPVEIYTALAVFFLLICLPLNGLALWLKARFTRDLSEQ